MKLTHRQRTILTLLKTRGHAMPKWSMCADLDIKFITVNTLNRLRDRDCIRYTDQGWLLTDIGWTAVETGVLP